MRPGYLVECIKCGGCFLPFSYVRANPLSKTLPLQCDPPPVICHWHGYGSSLRPYHLSVWALRNCIGVLGLGCDTWYDYLIKFLYPTIAFQNSSFSLLFEEKNGVLILSDWLHTHLCFSHVRMSLHIPYNSPWCFGVCNVSLNAQCDTLSCISYGEVKILQLIFFLEIWGGVTPT